MSLCNFLFAFDHELSYLQIADHMWPVSVHDTLVIVGETLSEILISLS